MASLNRLTSKLEMLTNAYLVLRIAELERMLAERAELGLYEVLFDLRDLTPEERATLRQINTDVEARKCQR